MLHMKLFRRMVCKMEPQKPDFDIMMGGQQELTSELVLTKFTAARSQEMAALKHSLENPFKTTLVSQNMSRRRRRKAMSHDPRRVPRDQREAHINQLDKSGRPIKGKRPRRLYRKRSRNLLAEYNRRQKKIVWPETHIHHAKRFHMTEKWDYKIANFSNDKSVRACYRASARYCLLQDLSYNACIELEGPESILLEGLSHITDPACGLTFKAVAYRSGTREGKTVLFHEGMYPHGAIGEVTFLWKPCTSQETVRNLWLWVHPSFHAEVVDELGLVFGLKEEGEEEGEDQGKKRRKLCEETRQNVDQIKLEPRNIPFIRVPRFASRDGRVRMALLKDTLNRFRLTGPESLAVLQSCLQPASLWEAKNSVRKARVEGPNGGLSHLQGAVKRDTNGCVKSTSNLLYEMEVMGSDISSSGEDNEGSLVLKHKQSWKRSKWWQDYYVGEERKVAETQRNTWKMLQGVLSPANLPPNCILGLTVRDPRVVMAPKRTKVVQDVDAALPTSGESVHILQEIVSASPLWEAWVRDEVSTTKLSDNQMNELKSRLSVPGTPMHLSQDESRVPIILIQRPGSQDPKWKGPGFASGWDVIIPASWAMAFWIGLVMRGVQVGGLRETMSTACEEGRLPPPWNCPDSAACSQEETVNRREKTDQHFRYGIKSWELDSATLIIKCIGGHRGQTW